LQREKDALPAVLVGASSLAKNPLTNPLLLNFRTSLLD